MLSNDDVLDGLWDMHFDECTPIQEQTIPAVLSGRDVLACAQTGTGKTAAYLLPVIDMLADGNYPVNAVNCVIMAPTRELAQQIDRQMQGFAYFMPVSSIAVYGGTDGVTYEQQRKSLKMGADVVIATPGRLLAHLSMGYVNLSEVSFFVLDEADRMLDMGFYDDIMQIFSHLPKTVQVLMFSATMPAKIQHMAKKILKDPVEIKLAVSKPAEKIRQSAYICYEAQKMGILKHLFSLQPPRRVIIFSGSKIKVKNLAREFRKAPFKVAEMHSDLDQNERDNVMLDFKAGNTNVIIATDILSRGIDIDDIEMVINFDVPGEPEDYVHRIGRTARADRDGRAVTFIAPEEMFRLHRIERLLEKQVPREAVPSELGEPPVEKTANPAKKGRGRGSRHSRRGNAKTKNPIASGKQKEVTSMPDQPITERPDASGEKKSVKRRYHRKRNHAPSGNKAKSNTSETESTK